MDSCYIVICRDDEQADGIKGEYVLATRKQFTTRGGADTYASQCSQSREPIVVECPRGLTYPAPERLTAEAVAYQVGEKLNRMQQQGLHIPVYVASGINAELSNFTGISEEFRRGLVPADWRTAANAVAQEFIPLFNEMDHSDLQGCIGAAVAKYNLGAHSFDAENLALELVHEAAADAASYGWKEANPEL